MHVTDSPNLLLPLALTVNETITVSDAPTFPPGFGLAPLPLSINETITVSDAVSLPPGLRQGRTVQHPRPVR